MLLATGGRRQLESLRTALGKKHFRTLSFQEMCDIYPRLPDGLCAVDLCSEMKLEASPPGVAAISGGALAFRALQWACDLTERSPPAALVTAPISKESVVASGQSGFVGHTEYLAGRANCEVLMLMHGRKLSVVPLTIHVALREAPQRLRETLQSAGLIRLLGKLLSMPPFRGRRAALLGLNPHAGEGGLLGDEEQRWLGPWCEALRQAGVPVEGPLSADGFFFEEVRREFRLALACYHDQGLAPFKALEGRDGLNVTIGLPYLRISPDHGVAFAIAGRGRCDASSMRRALQAGYAGSIAE